MDRAPIIYVYTFYVFAMSNLLVSNSLQDIITFGYSFP